MREPVTELALDTPAGLLSVAAGCRDGTCESVTFDNVPCLCTGLNVPVEVPEFIHEGILSPTFRAQIAGRARVGDREAMIPRIAGRNSIHATSQIGVDPSAPLPTGYTLPDAWGSGPTHRLWHAQAVAA
jgi:proline racemase